MKMLILYSLFREIDMGAQIILSMEDQNVRIINTKVMFNVFNNVNNSMISIGTSVDIIFNNVNDSVISFD